ncbi:MAG: EAL domain-containing protein [Lachnospiraceae bacterium]|nr:EAL domain-containing protein [Lachnospiraceae bacterium]
MSFLLMNVSAISFGFTEITLSICTVLLIVILLCQIIRIRQSAKEKNNENVQQPSKLEKEYKKLEDAYQQLKMANNKLDEKYEELKVSEERNKKLAYVDYLTDLPNRTAFTEYLEYSLSVLKKGHILSVMYIDIDNFKLINDSLGHSYGDELLLDCTERLKQVLDTNDYLARFGGDEFIILTENVINMWEYEEKINTVQRIFAQPFILALKEHFVSASIGVAIAPKDSNNAQMLLKNVDLALYRAKSIGKNNICFYEPSMNEQIMTKMETQSELHKAIREGQFELYYQPQVDLDADKIVGFESLLRWNHPEKGVITPDKFLPLAEDTGMIGTIGSWVLREACNQLKSWQDQGFSGITMAVNLAARQFKDPDLVNMVENAVRQSGIKPEDLELEITESVALDDITYAIDTISQLKDLGIKFSLDDFGTGYSSLNYLKYLPVSNIKIDKSFIDTIIEDKSDKAIVSAIITLARNFDLDVIAEGVENTDQVSFLKEAQCNIVQGYLYSIPVSKKDADSLLHNMGKDEIHNRFKNGM